MTQLRQFSNYGFLIVTAQCTPYSLKSLALETGGEAFLGGITIKKMVHRIASDLGCLYLLSFAPGDLPRDSSLRVLLRVKRPRVTAQTRGRLVIQSEQARRTSRLMAAFAAPDSAKMAGRLRAAVIPTGFEDGKYTALVQIAARVPMDPEQFIVAETPGEPLDQANPVQQAGYAAPSTMAPAGTMIPTTSVPVAIPTQQKTEPQWQSISG